MAGIFADWQPRYAEAGICTFPVRDKRPAVRGYLRLGARASGTLAEKFRDENAFGFACKRNRITVLDVDTPDERVLADALAEHGQTPVIVRSGSGNWQAWYRHDGEGRRVRPNPDLPIDILGDGFVVAPPSVGVRRHYEFVQGGLADIANLPKRAGPPQTNSVYNRHTPSSLSSSSAGVAPASGAIGTRNDALWRGAMTLARTCSTIEQLMGEVMKINQTYPEPLSAEEVLKVVASAWGYQVDGRNWIECEGRATIKREEILAFPGNHSLRLWLLLKQSHQGREEPFAISQNEVSALLGIRQQHMHRHIRALIEKGYIRRVHRGAGKGDPHLYAFAKGGMA
jgi:hypothetical protein